MKKDSRKLDSRPEAPYKKRREESKTNIDKENKMVEESEGKEEETKQKRPKRVSARKGVEQNEEQEFVEDAPAAQKHTQNRRKGSKEEVMSTKKRDKQKSDSLALPETESVFAKVNPIGLGAECVEGYTREGEILRKRGPKEKRPRSRSATEADVVGTPETELCRKEKPKEVKEAPAKKKGVARRSAVSQAAQFEVILILDSDEEQEPQADVPPFDTERDRALPEKARQPVNGEKRSRESEKEEVKEASSQKKRRKFLDLNNSSSDLDLPRISKDISTQPPASTKDTNALPTVEPPRHLCILPSKRKAPKSEKESKKSRKKNTKANEDKDGVKHTAPANCSPTRLLSISPTILQQKAIPQKQAQTQTSEKHNQIQTNTQKSKEAQRLQELKQTETKIQQTQTRESRKKQRRTEDKANAPPELQTESKLKKRRVSEEQDQQGDGRAQEREQEEEARDIEVQVQKQEEEVRGRTHGVPITIHTPTPEQTAEFDDLLADFIF